MITDKKTTAGVPSGNAFSMPGVSKRTQFVKPNQAANLGRSAAARPSQTPQRAATPAGLYNPVQPRRAAQTSDNATSTQPAAVRAVSSNLPSLAVPSAASQGGAAAGTVSDPLRASRTASARSEMPRGGSTLLNAHAPTEASVASQAVSAPASGLEQARSTIRGLSSTDISSLLDELASGTLRGTD